MIFKTPLYRAAYLCHCKHTLCFCSMTRSSEAPEAARLLPAAARPGPAAAPPGPPPVPPSTAPPSAEPEPDPSAQAESEHADRSQLHKLLEALAKPDTKATCEALVQDCTRFGSKECQAFWYWSPSYKYWYRCENGILGRGNCRPPMIGRISNSLQATEIKLPEIKTHANLETHWPSLNLVSGESEWIIYEVKEATHVKFAVATQKRQTKEDFKFYVGIFALPP